MSNDKRAADDAEREAFEAWVSASGREHMLERDHPHLWYKDLTVSAWWTAWQARAALSSRADGGKGEAVFPDRDVSKPAEQQGIFRKFEVRRVDGSDQSGGKHHECRYFVLDMDHDAHAPAALRAYADSCANSHPQLAADLRAEFGKGEAAAARKLDAARGWIEDREHGDNCFVSIQYAGDPGSRCNCGKDAILSYLDHPDAAPQAEDAPRKYDPATQWGDPNFDGAEAYEAHLEAECAPREAQPKEYERHDPDNATAPFLSFIPDAKRDELIGALLESLERSDQRKTDFYMVRAFIGGLGLLAAQFGPTPECAPREAQPVADTVRECLSDVVSHYRALYAGLAFQLNEATNTENSDDMAYWKHEIKALERMYVQAESALAAPTPERAPCGSGMIDAMEDFAPVPAPREAQPVPWTYDQVVMLCETDGVPLPVEFIEWVAEKMTRAANDALAAPTPERADADTATCPNCKGTGSHGGRFHTDGKGSSEYEPYKCDVCNGFGRVSADADKRELSWQEGYKTGYDDAETVAKHAAGASERADAEKDAALTDAWIEHEIEISGGYWVDGEFRIDCKDLMTLCRAILGR